MAVLLLGVTAVVNLSYFQINTFPTIDREAGTRSLWKAIEPHQSETCIGDVRRHVVYGLDFYSANRLPRCAETSHPYRVTGDPARLLGPHSTSHAEFSVTSPPHTAKEGTGGEIRLAPRG